MGEFATEKVWIRASQELLEDMLEGWSRPVIVRAEKMPDGSWSMIFKTIDFIGWNEVEQS
jgi:hypothetical protein